MSLPFGRTAFRRVVPIAVPIVVTLLLALLPARAYAPGSGTLYSDDFEGTLDPDWEQEGGLQTETSPWTLVADGLDTSFHSGGVGPGAPTLHRARHHLRPALPAGFSVALEIRTERGNGYHFDLEAEQRAPVPRRYRLRVEDDGAVSLWRTEAGVHARMVSTAGNTIPKNKTRWVRLAIEEGSGGHSLVRARIWAGGASSEPTSWNLEFLDELDTLERVNRLELVADGPRAVETWIDDLEVWGDVGSGVLSSVETIYIVEHSHVDIGFTHPPDEIEAFAKTHLDQVLDNLEADPDYRWTIENGWCLDRWWERSSQVERDRMIAHLRGDRLSLAANYTNLTTAAAGHEELSRAVYWSNAMGRTHGFPVRTWYQDDVPGATFALPEMLARSGIEYYVGGMNASFGGDLTGPDHGDQPFWWVGPDGSRVLAWISFDSYVAAFDYGFSFFDNLADMYLKLAKKLPEMEEYGYPFPELMLQRAFDNHYQGFHARNLVGQWNAAYETPVFVLATAEEFLDHLVATYGTEAFPSFSGDFGAAWGWLTAYAQHSQAWIRQAHREGRAAEALLAAGASLDGAALPRDDIAFLYRRMLEFDEHTNAGGWPGYYTPEEMDRHNTIHMGYATDARDHAASLLGEGLDRALAELSAAGDAVVAVNPLGRDRDGWMRVALPDPLYGTTFRVVERGTGAERPYQRFDGGREILFRAEQVPALGYRVYDLVPGEPGGALPGMLVATASSLENDHYRLEIDPADGSVTSLTYKPTGRELVDTASSYRFNELATNTHQQAVLQNPPVASPPAGASTSIETEGPLVASLRVTRTGTPHVETVYRLYRGEDRVEIENVLDRDLMDFVSNEMHTLSHTVTLPFDIHDFEIRSETTTRFLDPVGDSFARDAVFDYHDVEHTLAFWDETGGVHYAVDNALCHHFEHISNLGSSAYANGDALLLTRLKDKHGEYEFQGGAIGPFELEPGTGPLYRHRQHLRATDPGFDPVAASRFGMEALSPLLPRLLARGPGNLPPEAASWFSVDAPGVLLYTVKPAERGEGVILRMSELTGVETPVWVSSEVFLLESPERVEQDEDGGQALSGDGEGFALILGPYETATVRTRARAGWEPVTLAVSEEPGSGSVRLSWSGGVSPFTLRRAGEAAFAQDAVLLVDEGAVTVHDDPVLEDGEIYFYLAE